MPVDVDQCSNTPSVAYSALKVLDRRRNEASPLMLNSLDATLSPMISSDLQHTAATTEEGEFSLSSLRVCKVAA
jgi:hypothetical protein